MAANAAPTANDAVGRCRFDRHLDGSYNGINHVDSPDEAIQDESVEWEFRRLFRRFLSHVT